MRKIIVILAILGLISGCSFLTPSEEVSKDIEKTPMAESSIPTPVIELPEEGEKLAMEQSESEKYCIEQKGIISEREKDDGSIQQICFVNDGKDGIHCDLDLFFSKECGHGDPSAADVDFNDIEVRVNTSGEGNVALIAKAPNGESMALLTKKVDGVEIADSMVITTSDGESGFMTFGSDGKPATFEYKNYTNKFSNYSDKTVDVEIISPDGSSEKIEGLPITDDSVISSLIFSTAHAANPYAGVKEDTPPSEKTSYYVEVGTLGASVVSCGIAGAATYASGGLLAPFAYLGCGTTLIRSGYYGLTSLDCKGSKQEVIDCVNKEVEGELDLGPVFYGKVTDSETGQGIPNVALQIRRRNGSIISSRITDSGGDYKMDGIYVDRYTMIATAPEYNEQKFDILISGNRLHIKNTNNEKVTHDGGYKSGSHKYDHNLNFTLTKTAGLNGTWTGEAQDSSGDPDCGGGSFTFEVKDGTLSGLAHAAEGFNLKLTGKVNSSGTIEVGAADGSYDDARFSGRLDAFSKEGSGTWSSAEGCGGSWSGTKQ